MKRLNDLPPHLAPADPPSQGVQSSPDGGGSFFHAAALVVTGLGMLFCILWPVETPASAAVALDGQVTPPAGATYTWEDSTGGYELVSISDVARTVTITSAGLAAGWRCQTGTLR